MKFINLIILTLFIPAIAHSENAVREPAAIPRAERAFVSDRPGVTDNPHSMNAGEFRMESGVFAVGLGHSDTSTTTTHTFGNISLVGAISNETELQLSIDSLVQRSVSDGVQTRDSGVGDSTFKIKRNLYGNDGGEFAVAILPRVTLLSPLNGGRLDGGLSVSMAYLPSSAWAITLMPQYNLIHDASLSRVQQLAFGLAIAREISSRWWGLVQYSAKYTENSMGTNNAGFGAAYTVNSRLQLDAVLDYQVKSNSPDSNFTCGFTYKF